ncbi:unnamed protein product [Brachionus calyciflorus]|uniref:Uncharacterized protein n=1 Tax=Brachionus calyciflorus TaxID=104777 RepID=A0A814KG20_9BILA|nr:unnamed protein product [Brachionus calyciflorus]
MRKISPISKLPLNNQIKNEIYSEEIDNPIQRSNEKNLNIQSNMNDLYIEIQSLYRENFSLIEKISGLEKENLSLQSTRYHNNNSKIPSDDEKMDFVQSVFHNNLKSENPFQNQIRTQFYDNFSNHNFQLNSNIRSHFNSILKDSEEIDNPIQRSNGFETKSAGHNSSSSDSEKDQTESETDYSSNKNNYSLYLASDSKLDFKDPLYVL